MNESSSFNATLVKIDNATMVKKKEKSYLEKERKYGMVY